MFLRIWNNGPIISKVLQNPMGKMVGVVGRFYRTEVVAETRRTEGTPRLPIPVEGKVVGRISRRKDRPCRPCHPRRHRCHPRYPRHRLYQYPETVRNRAKLVLW